MSDYQPTQIAKGDGPLPRNEVVTSYRSLEGRAVALMEGWDNLLGVTPDDLAQAALDSYHELRLNGHNVDSARTLASKGLRDDFLDLKRKANRRKESYFPEDEPEPSEDVDEDLGEAELPWSEPVALYFSPDQVDWLADRLSPREMEVVLLVFESDLTHVDAARRMHISKQRVTQLIQSAIVKIREVWPSSQ